MRIVGRRLDGALCLNVGGGLACILKGDRVSPVVDCSVTDKLGPWHLPEELKTFEARRYAQARVDLAKVAQMDHFVFNGAMSFDETRERVSNAIKTKLGLPSGGMYAYSPMGMDFYIPQNGMGDDWVVYCVQGKHFGMTYSIDDMGNVTLGSPVEVHQTWESLDESQEFAVELKQSEWFKKFMATKKKNMAKTNATDLPGSLPNIGTSKVLTDLPGSLPNIGTKKVLTDLPGSLPNLDKKAMTSMPGSLPNLSKNT